MAVFRVERTRNYTVMCNHHLRDETLSLKAKGLLSQMLSLPEGWDYTLGGLVAINQESKDAIRNAVNELERAGYIRRRQTTDANGRFSGNEYVIYEVPQPDAPLLDNPTTDNPPTENPSAENPTQLNKDKTNTERSNNDSIPFRAAYGPDTTRTEAQEPEYRELIRENMELDLLCAQHPDETEILTEIYELLVETVTARRKRIRVAGSDFVHESVKSRLLKLNSEHIRFVLEGLKQNTTQIRSMKQYLLAALYNAPVTFNAKTMADVNHGLYGGRGP